MPSSMSLDNKENKKCAYDKESDYQNWNYDMNTKQLISLDKENGKCASTLGFSSNNGILSMQACNASDISQKWTFGYINETALNNFDNIDFEDNIFKGYHLTS
ncbi:CLUMA_CG008188, isoform A [Clunio marinus]|uniref:CLUMA_CG008188, isoform A n=1 Tax=Clunio marinus TaxID=568069 RepID=A0A1J1I305_9DIPT|nr:CLUMA_CG008188, isoform A [Clunio marinus]